jgi:hypothetical protein
MKKSVVRIMKGCGSGDSCRKHFRDRYILPLRSQFIYSLIFEIKNREIFDMNKVHYEINTRHIMDIHMTQVNLAVIWQRGVSYDCKDLQCASKHT